MNRSDEAAEQSASSLQYNEENINYEQAFREMQKKEKELSQRTEMLEKMMQTLSMLLPSPQSSPSCSTSVAAPTFSSPAPLSNSSVNPPISTGYPKSYLCDVLELVPKYDGHNIPVWQFARACKRAMESVPLVDEALFVRMLRNKLSHHAYLAVEDEIHPTVGKFLDCLKRTFGSGRNANYYRGQLSMAYKKQNEHVLDYIGRVKDLKTAIIEGDVHTLERSLSNAEIASIEAFALDAFFEGLPREYRVELRAEGYSGFSDACTKVIIISKRLEREKLRYKMARTSRDNPMQQNSVRVQQRDSSAASNLPVNSPDLTGRKICSYCKKLGHLANDCFKRQYRDGPYNNTNNNNDNINNKFNNNRGNNTTSTGAGNSMEASANGTPRGLAKDRPNPVHSVEISPARCTSFEGMTEEFHPSCSYPIPLPDQ